MLGPPKARDFDRPVLIAIESYVPKNHLYRHLRAACNDAHTVGDHDRGLAIVRETNALVARMRRHIDTGRDANTPMEAGGRNE